MRGSVRNDVGGFFLIFAFASIVASFAFALSGDCDDGGNGYTISTAIAGIATTLGISLLPRPSGVGRFVLAVVLGLAVIGVLVVLGLVLFIGRCTA
jgi:hypothetical protein